nr:cycloartenol Synthase isoform X1 [Ipomoea batatas]
MNHASQVRRKKSIQEADELEFYVARRLGATTWSLPGPMTAQMDEARRRSCVQRERIRRKLFPRSVLLALLQHLAMKGWLSTGAEGNAVPRMNRVWLLGCLFFMYGLWFGVGGLVAAGRNFNNSSSIRKACEFLLSKQLPSGGWGESYLSSSKVVVFKRRVAMAKARGDMYKQAAFCYEELILSHPMVPLYDLAYADVSDLFASFMSLLQI